MVKKIVCGDILLRLDNRTPVKASEEFTQGRIFLRSKYQRFFFIAKQNKFSKTLLALGVFFFCSIALRAEEGPQQFEGFNLVGYTDGGKKAWDVKGDTANVLGTAISLTNIVANAYGDQQMNLTAKTGTIDQASGNMHLERDVVITTQKGSQLTTDSLDWQREKDVVSTKDPVKIKDPKLTATGTGAVAHPNLKTAQMNEDITVTVNDAMDKAGEKITITCDGPLEIDQAKQQAFFNKNVVAYQKGRELKADRIEVYFDQTKNQIKQMICLGNVAITMGENTTYSEKAVYTAQDQKLILSGRPKLILYTEGQDGLTTPGN